MACCIHDHMFYNVRTRFTMFLHRASSMYVVFLTNDVDIFVSICIYIFSPFIFIFMPKTQLHAL